MCFPSRRLFVAIAGCLLVQALLRPATSAAEISDFIGRPVATLRLVLDGRETTDPTLLQLVETQVGRPLSMLQVRDTVTHLFSLGRFDDVRVDAGMSETGVALTYELTPVHIVSNIEFAGDLSGRDIDTGQLRRAVVDRYGTSPSLGRLNELATVVADALGQLGYRAARIDPQVKVERGSQRATLVFAIEPGARTRVGSIDVVGMPMMPVKDFLDRLDLAQGVPYEPDALNTRIAAYVDTRRERGYYEARVTPTVTLADEDRIANITLTVDVGPHGGVRYTGDPLPGNPRDELVPIEREGTADQDLL
jgi:outer membrane protein assembly factor BamA